MKPPPPTRFASALRAFFSQHLPLTRGLSPRTTRSYRDAFVLLLRFLSKLHRCAVVDLDLGHLIEVCISNRHFGHKKAGSSEAVTKDRMSAGRRRTLLVRRQSIVSSSLTLSG